MRGQHQTFCPRCSWSEFNVNLDGSPTDNPPDPTIEMHRGIQASADPQVSYHLTDNPQFALDPAYRPANNTALGGDWPEPGLFVGNANHWFTHPQYHYVRPYVAEIEHPPLGEFGGYGREGFLPASSFPQSRVRRVIPYDEYEREKFRTPGHIESFHDPSLGNQRLPSGYRYTGPDVRDMSPEEHARHAERTDAYFRRIHPEAFRAGVYCPRCQTDEETFGNPDLGYVNCMMCGDQISTPKGVRAAHKPKIAMPWTDESDDAQWYGEHSPAPTGEPQYMYHVGFPHHRDSILREGLRPEKGAYGGTPRYQAQEQMDDEFGGDWSEDDLNDEMQYRNKVWLHPTLESAQKMNGYEDGGWGGNNDIYRVNVAGLPLQQEGDDWGASSTHNTIRPDRLELLQAGGRTASGPSLPVWRGRWLQAVEDF